MTVSKIRMANILFATHSLGLELGVAESGKVLVVDPNTGAIIYHGQSAIADRFQSFLKGVLNSG